jgi:hypothetical protein
MTRIFWQQWLHIWCWAMIGLGVVFSAAGVPGLDGAAGAFYQMVSLGTLSAADFAAPGMRLTVSLAGAVMLGWGLCLLAIYRACGADPVVWRGLGWGVFGWWAADSALSMLNGVPVNVVTNTVLVTAYLVPAVKLGFFKPETGSRSPA